MYGVHSDVTATYGCVKHKYRKDKLAGEKTKWRST